mmetsp:Transcript_25907/g.103561  ORF Transcript_25907/g.103561 Transcript_25907/m.103561 type:complete len:332 (-) Transcript_25907:656-1651(-)
MCRLWRLGIPQVNLLANKAALTDDAALRDDGRPCATNTVYGMETYAWHADEASRPADLSVKYTAFHARKVDNASQGETHFLSAVRAFDALPLELKTLAATLEVKYVANPKSRDAFLPPLDVAGKHDGYLTKDGTSKSDEAAAGAYLDALAQTCADRGTCAPHSSPLVTPHPRTRRPALHLDVKQQLGFEGLNFTESQRILGAIMRPAASPDRVYRHRWRVGDVVVADNFHVLHTAAPGEAFNDAARLIERICVPGGYVPPKLDDTTDVDDDESSVSAAAAVRRAAVGGVRRPHGDASAASPANERRVEFLGPVPPHLARPSASSAAAAAAA